MDIGDKLREVAEQVGADLARAAELADKRIEREAALGEREIALAASHAEHWVQPAEHWGSETHAMALIAERLAAPGEASTEPAPVEKTTDADADAQKTEAE